jgi:hypothetical protein
MQDFLDIVIVIFTVVVGVLFVFLTLMYGTYWVTVNVSEVNIVKVTVDGKEIYTGKRAFVSVSSGGYTTTVQVYSKLFPFRVVEKTYTSKDVTVVQQ